MSRSHCSMSGFRPRGLQDLQNPSNSSKISRPSVPFHQDLQGRPAPRLQRSRDRTICHYLLRSTNERINPADPLGCDRGCDADARANGLLTQSSAESLVGRTLARPTDSPHFDSPFVRKRFSVGAAIGCAVTGHRRSLVARVPTASVGTNINRIGTRRSAQETLCWHGVLYGAACLQHTVGEIQRGLGDFNCTAHRSAANERIDGWLPRAHLGGHGSTARLSRKRSICCASRDCICLLLDG